MVEFCEECGSIIDDNTDMCSKQSCVLEQKIRGFESKPKRKTRWERRKKQ